MTLAFNTHLPSITQLVVCIYQLSGHRLLYFLQNSLFLLFPIEKPKLQKLDQPRVIILRNYDGLESPMLHAKFRGNRPSGSGEEAF